MESKKTTVVHCKKHPYDIYIGRGSKWGNPYTHIKDRQTKADHIVSSRKEAINMYRKWIMLRPDLLAELSELQGKTLGCYCKPNSCHGDVLIELIKEYCI